MENSPQNNRGYTDIFTVYSHVVLLACSLAGRVTSMQIAVNHQSRETLQAAVTRLCVLKIPC